jgi:ribosomal protein S27E
MIENLKKSGDSMSEQEFLTGKCPKCGEELKVPANLEQFSCLYCGARLTPADLTQAPAAPEPLDLGEAEASYQAALARLAECVTRYPGYNRKITKTEFEPAFAAYQAGCQPIFEQLSRGIEPLAEGQSEKIAAAAERMLDDLEAAWQASPKWKSKMNQAGIMEDDKIIIAIFTVPLVRYLKLPISEEFAVQLQKKWVERHPKSPFYLGDYESISGGFRKKFLGLCFITTAVCEEQGLPDDCAELTAFRAFRDGYLRACPDGEALIREYYDIAPGIVSCLNVCGDRHENYAAIRENYLDACYRDLQAGRLEACKTRYTAMVRELERRYLS